MPKHGKNYRGAVEKLAAEPLGLEDGVRLARECGFAKFDESLEVAMRLGVDPKHADQMVRGTVALPHGTGRSVRVLVFASGEQLKEAEDAGADHVGGDELAAKIQGGWLDFDAVVATPDMMKVAGRLGRVLGPRGLMPNPKTGTVTADVAKAVEDIKGGKVEFRVDKAGNLQAAVGKLSFDQEKLEENARALIDAVLRAKPASSKGRYVKTIHLSSTMGPGIELDSAEVARQEV
jgi:large subunit ribosomal protein L1